MPGPNHPWSTKGRIFNCDPQCPKREPGCQDHCKTYLDAKAINDKRLEDERLKHKVDGYMLDGIRANRDTAARRKRLGYE